MSERGDARVSPGVLVWLTVGALALGGWWWVENPPAESSSGTASTLDVAGPGQPRELRAEVTFPQPEAGSPRLVPVEQDGAEPVWAVVEDPGADAFLDEQVAPVLLPNTENVVLRRAAVLGPGDIVVHDGPAPTSGDYLLEAVCHGDGEVVLVGTLPDRDAGQHRLACDGEAMAIEFAYSRPGYAAIQLSAPDARDPLLVAFQVSRA